MAICTGFVVALSLLCAPAPIDDPFVDLSYEDALSLVEPGAILLVYCTRSDFAPYETMQDETWAAEAVRSLLDEHALCIRIDLDGRSEIVEELQIAGLPAFVAIKDGDVFDRSYGAKEPERFLEWFRGVVAGKTERDIVLEGDAALLQSDDVDRRYDHARNLLRYELDDQAHAHYSWLWVHSLNQPSYGGVRRSYMISEIAFLATRHEPTRREFMDLLDDLDQRLTSSPSLGPYEELADWFVLSEHLEDDATVLRWFDREREEDGSLTLSSLVGFRQRYVRDQVADALARAARYAEALHLMGDLASLTKTEVASYRRDVEKRIDSGSSGQQALMANAERSMLRHQLARFYLVALGAGRRELANEIGGTLIETLDDLDSRRTLLWVTVLNDLEPTRKHWTWMDEAEALGAELGDLREQLARSGRQ